MLKSDVREPDLRWYYPSVVANAKEFEAIAATENPELCALWKELWQIFSNSFVMSTDINGIKRWEDMLGVTSKPDSTLLDRQRKILAIINASVPYTERKLISILDALIGEGAWEMDLNTVAETLGITVNLGKSNAVIGVLSFLRPIIPANIGMSMTAKLEHDMNLYYGLANIPIGRKTIKLSFPKGHKQSSYTGVALSWGGVKHIGVQNPGDFHYDSFIAFADAKTGRKTIGFDTDDLHYTPLGDLELFFKTGAVYINAGKKHIAACEDRKTVYEAETRAGITNVVYGTRVIGGLKYLDDMLSKAFGGMYSIRRGTMKIGGLR